MTAAGPASREGVLRRQSLLLSGAALVAGVLCMLMWVSTRATAGDLANRTRRAGALAQDARTIASLRARPLQATEVGLQLSDLLDRVGQAMRTAGIPADALISTLPQPPRRMSGSDHAEVVHRLVFKGVTMEGLVRFGYALKADNPQLSVTGVQLRPGAGPQGWQAEAEISYLILDRSK